MDDEALEGDGDGERLNNDLSVAVAAKEEHEQVGAGVEDDRRGENGEAEREQGFGLFNKV
ncbi:Protein kinase domain-containing protein [Psidium guajava]|nr:Protein kinase domain-containing protein [Psidium guajava]